MSKKTEYLDNEWTYFFDVNTLDDGAVHLEVMPDADERADLARRLRIVSVDTLVAHIDIAKNPATMVVQVNGSLTAHVTQKCVVTLEPVEGHIEEAFEAWYADPARAVSFVKKQRDRQVKKGGVELPILEEHEDPEDIIDGQIDIGELVAQYLSLGLNPYPHAEGAEFERGDDQFQDTDSDLTRNPFAKLKDWKAQNPD